MVTSLMIPAVRYGKKVDCRGGIVLDYFPVASSLCITFEFCVVCCDDDSLLGVFIYSCSFFL